MRLYVANVGVNSSDARARGLRSPVFPDGTFEFVPIKEAARFARAPGIQRYEDLPSWTGRYRNIGEILPTRVRAYRAHADPEFGTFTYGDVTSPRASALRRIEPGDSLWFLARLWSHDGNGWTGRSAFYFVGYLDVEDNIAFDGLRSAAVLSPRLGANAHVRRLRAGSSERFRVIAGSSVSARFARALEITPIVAAHLFGGTYDTASGNFTADGQVLTNRNGKPRRLERFGSITRTIQCFLTDAVVEHAPHLSALGALAKASGKAKAPALAPIP